MTPSQTAEIVVMASALRGQAVDEALVAAWHAVIGDLDYQDAAQAARTHLREKSSWLTPRDVIAGVEAIEKTRRVVAKLHRDAQQAALEPGFDAGVWWAQASRVHGRDEGAREYAEQQAHKMGVRSVTRAIAAAKAAEPVAPAPTVTLKMLAEELDQGRQRTT